MNDATRSIIDLFERISAVPRGSGREKRISDWLSTWAEKRSIPVKTDAKGNLLIRVPATSGYESAPGVALQGHMDMVCEKTPESSHDFSKDPITLQFDGDWITAEDTTLGADNGIAIALILGLVEDETAAHPALELLFTVDEETGLTGANALEPGFIEGRILINLDSEEEGTFTIGCAGGRDVVLTLNIDRDPPVEGNGIEIKVGGLAGGHSGADIHKYLANANKLLARILHDLVANAGAQIVSISGGSVRNAIPRDARAVVVVPEGEVSGALDTVAGWEETFKLEYGENEKDLKVSSESVTLEKAAPLSPDVASRLIDLLIALPNGAQAYSPDIHGLVETSCNVAVIEDTGEKIEIHTSQRSSVMSRLQEISSAVESAGRLARTETLSENSYPAWTPNMDSPLLAKCKDVYRRMYGKEVKIKAIHAGLECGVIGAKYDGMDMISMGPTIKHAHSPDERVEIPSIERTYELLKSLLESFREEM